MDKVTLPVMYAIGDKCIPARLSLAERHTFVLGAGAPAAVAPVLAMQDRAASLAASLSLLIERTNDPELVRVANTLVERWNRECDEFFASTKVPR